MLITQCNYWAVVVSLRLRLTQNNHTKATTTARMIARPPNEPPSIASRGGPDDGCAVALALEEEVAGSVLAVKVVVSDLVLLTVEKTVVVTGPQSSWTQAVRGPDKENVLVMQRNIVNVSDVVVE